MTLRSSRDGSMFVEHQPGNAPRVLALHGWGRQRSDLAELVSDRDALLVDLPGFGSSPPPPAAWGAEEYANAVAEYLREQSSAPCVVVGHSFGGRVGVALAANHPDLVRGLVLCGVPLVRIAPPAKPKRSVRLARWANHCGVLGDAALERVRHRHGSADYRAAQGIMRDVLVRVVGEDYSELLTRITAPVGFCWGERDTAVPVEIARRAAELVANVVVFDVVAGAGHDVMFDVEARTRAVLNAVIEAACAE